MSTFSLILVLFLLLAALPALNACMISREGRAAGSPPARKRTIVVLMLSGAGAGTFFTLRLSSGLGPDYDVEW